VVDLCCGLGGLSLAASELNMRIVAGVDLNSSALKTFARNFPQARAIQGSIRSSTVLERCDSLLKPASGCPAASLVLSGPPCQGFSAAGSRDPKDRRNKVLVAVARAITKLQPDCALIENVSMVLAEKHDDRLGSFEQALADGNFYVQGVILDASEFGLPQKRKRAFFLVTRGPLDRDYILKTLARHKMPLICAEEALRGLPTPAIRPDRYDDEADCEGVSNHFAMRHSKRVMEKIAAIPPGAGPMSYRKLHPGRPANTLFSGHRAPPAHFGEARSITVREAARLQGFPDDFRIYGSFANQMEQVTNAVPPPLARAVLRVLAEAANLD
jgi:DNA (cytosine-5)-methyltransferase 1